MKPTALIMSSAGMLALAGCAEVAVQGPPAGGGGGVSAVASEPAPGTAAAAVAPGTAGRVPPVPPPRPSGMAALPPPTPVPGSPDRPITELVGLGDADIAARMGEPHSVLRQPPATVWRYRLNGCVVDLFLFRDVQSDRLKSLSFAVARTPEAADRELDPRCTDAARSRTDG